MQNIILVNESELRDLISDSIKNLLESFKPVEQPKENELITRQETARILNISLPTLHAYSRDGKLKSYRIGSRIRYKRNEVIDSLNEVKTFKYKSYVS